MLVHSGESSADQPVPKSIPARLEHRLVPLRYLGAQEVHIPLRTLCRAAGMSLAPPKQDFSASMPLSARSGAGRNTDDRGCWHTQSKALQDWHLQVRDSVNGGVLFHGDGGRWNAAQLSSTQGAFDAAVVKLHALLEVPNAKLQEALDAELAEGSNGSGRNSPSRAESPDLEKQSTVIMGERLKWTKALVWSLAIWRRFGTVIFAQTTGWMFPEADVDAQRAAFNDLVEAAVCLWCSGQHAVLDGVEPAWHAFAVERRSWQLGGTKEQQERLRELEIVRVPTYSQGASSQDGIQKKRSEELRELRKALVTSAGEQAVRKAYQQLLFGRQQEVWDLWRTLDSVTKTALEVDFLQLIGRLSQVKGFDLASGFLAREVALDLKTMTPLADDAGPVTWSIDYVTWLRKRLRINPVAKAKLASQKVEKTVEKTITTKTTIVMKSEKSTEKKKKVLKCRITGRTIC